MNETKYDINTEEEYEKATRDCVPDEFLGTYPDLLIQKGEDGMWRLSEIEVWSNQESTKVDLKEGFSGLTVNPWFFKGVGSNTVVKNISAEEQSPQQTFFLKLEHPNWQEEIADSEYEILLQTDELVMVSKTPSKDKAN